MNLPADQTSLEKLGKSAATIAQYNFHWQYATFVLFNSTLVCSVDIFLRSYQKNVFVGRGTFYPGFVKRTQQYVIFGADVPDIVHMLTWMQKHQFDNTGLHIVLCLSERWEKCNEVDIINILWNFKIINVVLMNNLTENTIQTFTYYYPVDCKNARPVHLKNWNACLLYGREHCQSMYPLKLKNLHRCPVTVSTFDQVPYMNISNGRPTGVDGDILRVIAEKLNFTLVIMTPRIGFGWGVVADNGTWTGSLADVYNEWANFSMTAGCITMSRFRTFHISIDYAAITIGWITHPPEVQPSSLKLLRPFQPYVHIALAITFILIVLLKLSLRTRFLLSLRRELNIAFPYDIIFLSWKMCIGLPVSSLPSNTALSCLAVFWIWFCLLIRTLYQVYLINSLQTDVYDPKFDTIEESIAAKYNFGGGLPLRDYFIDNALVYDGWKKVESVEIYPVMVKLTEGLKFVLAMNIETTKMYLRSHPDKMLHILPGGVITSPTAIFFKKYSPLANSLNVILTRLKESGIIRKIYIDNTGKKYIKKKVDDNIPISMAHYTGCYAILLAGWLLSGVCFLLEKLMYKY